MAFFCCWLFRLCSELGLSFIKRNNFECFLVQCVPGSRIKMLSSAPPTSHPYNFNCNPQARRRWRMVRYYLFCFWNSKYILVALVWSIPSWISIFHVFYLCFWCEREPKWGAFANIPFKSKNQDARRTQQSATVDSTWPLCSTSISCDHILQGLYFFLCVPRKRSHTHPQFNVIGRYKSTLAQWPTGIPIPANIWKIYSHKLRMPRGGRERGERNGKKENRPPENLYKCFWLRLFVCLLIHFYSFCRSVCSQSSLSGSLCASFALVLSIALFMRLAKLINKEMIILHTMECGLSLSSIRLHRSF